MDWPWRARRFVRQVGQAAIRRARLREMRRTIEKGEPARAVEAALEMLSAGKKHPSISKMLFEAYRAAGDEASAAAVALFRREPDEIESLRHATLRDRARASMIRERWELAGERYLASGWPLHAAAMFARAERNDAVSAALDDALSDRRLRSDPYVDGLAHLVSGSMEPSTPRTRARLEHAKGLLSHAERAAFAANEAHRWDDVVCGLALVEHALGCDGAAIEWLRRWFGRASQRGLDRTTAAIAKDVFETLASWRCATGVATWLGDVDAWMRASPWAARTIGAQWARWSRDLGAAIAEVDPDVAAKCIAVADSLVLKVGSDRDELAPTNSAGGATWADLLDWECHGDVVELASESLARRQDGRRFEAMMVRLNALARPPDGSDDALLATLGRLGDAALFGALGWLQELLQHPSPSVRAAAIGAAMATSPAYALPMIRRGLRDPDELVRGVAINEIRFATFAPCNELLALGIEFDDARVRSAVAEVLAKQQSVPSLAALAVMVQHDASLAREASERLVTKDSILDLELALRTVRDHVADERQRAWIEACLAERERRDARFTSQS